MFYSKKSVQYLYRPVLHDVIPPLPIASDIRSDSFKWWKEQIRRCQHGWIAPDGVYINPIHYFYMNFVSIEIFGHKKDAIAELTNPFFRDNDKSILDFFWENMSKVTPSGDLIEAHNTLFAKPRAIAYTYMVNYAVNMWVFVFRPDKPIVFAYEEESLMAQESKDFIEAYKRLHPIFKRRNGEDLVIYNSSKELFSVILESERAKLKVTTSSTKKKSRAKDEELPLFNRAFFILGTRDKGKLKGKRLNMITIAEVGKWTKLKDFIAASEPCVTTGKYKFGMINAGGTSDDIAPDNKDFEELFEKPDALLFKVHLTYAYMVLHGFVDYETGKSDIASATAYIKQRLEQLKSERKSYIDFKSAFPLNKEDFFTPTIEYTYPTEEIEKQEEYVTKNLLNRDWRRGKLIAQTDIEGNPTGLVIFKEDPEDTPEKNKGFWWVNILKHPSKGIRGEFIATIDDVLKQYATQEKTDAAESKNCMIIYSKPSLYSPLSDMPVGMYFGRLRDNNETYYEFAKAMSFWDIQDASVFYEYHNMSFPNYLDSIGLKSRLYHINGEPGIKLLDTHKQQAVDLGNAYIKDQRLANWTNLKMLTSLKKWTLHKKVNDDIGSAIHLLFLFLDLIKYNQTVPIFQNTEVRRHQPFQLNSLRESVENKTELKRMNFRLGPRSVSDNLYDGA